MLRGEEPMRNFNHSLRGGLQFKIVLVLIRLNIIEVVVLKLLTQLVLLVVKITLERV